MGLTQKLGTIPLAILTDASNNVGIGAAPSGTYKLEVTGTAKVSSTLLVSGAATLSSTLSAGVTTINGNDSPLVIQATTVNKGIVIEYKNSAATRRGYIGYGADSSSLFEISNNENGDISFRANGSQRMLIGSGGKVGISNSVAADVLLNVVNGSSTGSGLNISAGSGSGTYALRVENYNGASSLLYVRGDGNVGIGTSNPSYKLVVSNNGADGLEVIPGTNTSGVVNLLAFNRSGGTYSDMRFDGNNLIFYTNGVGERMRITSGGNVGIGVSGTANTAVLLSLAGQDSTSSNYLINGYNLAGTALFAVRNDGIIFTGTAARSPFNDLNGAAANLIVVAGGNLQKSTASSGRYKENITDWSGNGLKTILALKPKTFTYKESYYKYSEVVMLGLIAEEVAEVSEYLADYENQDRTGLVENVRYATIVVPLIAAIQELNERLNKAGL
jgi:hypothetical protein